MRMWPEAFAPARVPARALLIPLAAAALLFACSSKPDATSLPRPSTPADFAERFLAAILDGDATQVDLMVTTDAWCTPPGLGTMIESGLGTFTNAHVREVHIQEVDVGGWLAYPPGTEAAAISLQFSLEEMEWRSAEVFIAVIDGGICDMRYSVD